jgi:hypothetical protein
VSGGPSPIPLAALVAAVVLMAALPAASALAQDDPSSAQYGAQIPEEGSGTASASDSGDEGSGLESNIAFLPFTGLDLLIISGVALVLAGTGFALRRASGHPSG